jgi:hypothetical protein
MEEDQVVIRNDKEKKGELPTPSTIPEQEKIIIVVVCHE